MKSNRREFVKNLGAGAAALGLAAPIGLSSCSGTEKKDDGQKLFIGDSIAVANTSSGKVRGYILNDIYYFIGIPYGADTSGANRFMPPKKAEPWSDVYQAIWWGNSAPQIRNNRYSNKYGAFRDHWNFDDISEDCLRMNVFTPGINDNAKRPVILWLHGGGFGSGNAVEHDGYKGENFARFGDVVFCSLNHRLNQFGFTDLSSIGGEKYAASGNVGMLDIVAGLEWIRDNISAFGGDPSNVTVMGQSGGGGKVSTLTTMPSAKGLFHKGVALSGTVSMVRLGEKDHALKQSEFILREAGLKASEVDKLQAMPWKDFYAIANQANSKLNKELGVPDNYFFTRFIPVVDGKIITQHPWINEASPLAADVPMIFSSVVDERSPSWNDASVESMTIDEVIMKVREISATGEKGLGDKAPEAVKAYQEAFPDKKPVEIFSLIQANRRSVVRAADAKSKQSAPVYMAWFGWDPPLFDNRLRAFHCLDICFWYYNTDYMLTHTGGGKRPRELSEKMAGSLVQFMKTGSPNGGGLPEWPEYSSEKGELMFLNDECEVQNDPDRKARETLMPYEDIIIS